MITIPFSPRTWSSTRAAMMRWGRDELDDQTIRELFNGFPPDPLAGVTIPFSELPLTGFTRGPRYRVMFDRITFLPADPSRPYLRPPG